MRKNYDSVRIDVIELGADDVITESPATEDTGFNLGGNDYGSQWDW